jgi:hypothetical protein
MLGATNQNVVACKTWRPWFEQSAKFFIIKPDSTIMLLKVVYICAQQLISVNFTYL